MKVRESIRSSVKSLFHNKLRSFLTMLGVIIGIFSVIMLTSIGEGVKKQVVSQVESLGANLIYVLPGKVDMKMLNNKENRLGVKQERLGQTKNTLTYDDVLNLKGKQGIAAATGIFNAVDYLNNLKIFVSTTGVDEDLIRINKMVLKRGRFISKTDREKKAKVAVIGSQANKELFKGKNSLGKSFKLNGSSYEVIGILQYKRPQGMGPQGDDLNIKIYLPITEVVERANYKNVGQILIKANSAKVIKEVEKTVLETLKKHHPPGEFSVLKQQDVLDAVNNILSMLTAALGGIAAISLVVGGIGIMNIMLVSVTERTREIGVRKAIGARQRDILIQFLIEAVILSILGGIVGLAIGISGSKILPTLFPTIRTALSIPAVITAMLFALLVGIFFGVYPASKAAKLNPIDALRSE